MKAIFAAAALVLVSGTAAAQPVTDARGIPVESMPATPPPGVNEVPPVPAGSRVTFAPDQQARFAMQPSTMTYPPCARGQTDRCTQTYEGRPGATGPRRSRR